MPKLLLAVLLVAAPLFGQLESNTISVTATRSIVVQPDQVVFNITVNSPLTTTLEQVVAALSPLGVTSADLSSVGNSAGQLLQWSFTYSAPIANLTSTIASLNTLQQKMTMRNMLSLSFSMSGTQVSQQLQQSQTCSNTELISDATAQAQTIAAAANLTLGPVLKLSNALTESGTFATAVLLFVPIYITPVQPITCSLVVQFQLLGIAAPMVRKP